MNPDFVIPHDLSALSLSELLDLLRKANELELAQHRASRLTFTSGDLGQLLGALRSAQ